MSNFFVCNSQFYILFYKIYVYSYTLARENNYSLKWRARGSEDGQRRRGRRKWRKRARVLVWRRRMPWIEQDGEWELEKLLLEWGKSGHPRLRGINPDQNWIDDDENMQSSSFFKANRVAMWSVQLWLYQNPVCLSLNFCIYYAFQQV